MKFLLGIMAAEFRMAVQRLGIWLVFLALAVLYIFIIPMMGQLPGLVGSEGNDEQVVTFAMSTCFYLNTFFTLVLGIVAADRMERDKRLGVKELLDSTPLRAGTYVLGKYLAALGFVCLPVFAFTLLYSLGLVVFIQANALVIPWMLLACLAVNFPAMAFVTAFALVCPLVMPVRIYQILFTGYWFWGNYVGEDLMPTLNGTWLCANGNIAIQGFFGTNLSVTTDKLRYLPQDAVINLIILAGCICLALSAGVLYLKRQSRLA